MGAIAGAPAAVFGVTGVARERKTGKRAPRAGSFKLPRPGVVQPADRHAEVRAGPVVHHLERGLRQAAIRHRGIAAHTRGGERRPGRKPDPDRKSTRLNSSHGYISYAVFCLKKKTAHRSRDHEHRRPSWPDGAWVSGPATSHQP